MPEWKSSPSDLGRQASEKQLDHLLAQIDDLKYQLSWARFALSQISNAEISKSQMKHEARIALAIIKNCEKE